SWARRLVASLKRCWRSEALPEAQRQVDRRLAEMAVTAHDDAEAAAGAESSLLRPASSGAARNLSKQGIRAAMTRRRMPVLAAEATRLRARTELLCDACELLLGEAGPERKSPCVREVEQLLDDASV
ncbi:unnamed protein product, partial [Polarella glacialis]